MSSVLVEVAAQVPQQRLEEEGERNSDRTATFTECIESNSFSKRQIRLLNSYEKQATTYRKNTLLHCV